MPGAGHFVHMPSHIYIRVGRYNDAVESKPKRRPSMPRTSRSINPGCVSDDVLPTQRPLLLGGGHLEGRGAESLRAARRLSAKLPVEMVRQMPMVEAFIPTYLFALVRFGKWQEILKQPAPPEDLPYTTGMWHYVRGLAFAAKKQWKKATAEYDKLTEIAKATPLEARVMMNSSAALLNLAANVLAGELAAKRGKTAEAVTHLETAVRQQDELRYEEPPPWYYPVRQSLGAVLLKAGRVVEAEAVYREDLKRNPENGWLLYGLTQSLRAQKKQEETTAVE